MADYLDIANWSRREQFGFFIGYTDPYFNVCVRVDVTELVDLVRKRPGVRVSMALHYFALRAANETEPFRYRLKDGRVFVYDVAPDKAERIPAVRHVDGTARIQTINRDQNPAYYDLVKAFAARTGVPVLVNTSFNTRSEPVVCTPRDAVECFWTSPIDALVLGPFLLEK